MSLTGTTRALYGQVAFTHPVRSANGQTCRGYLTEAGEQPTVVSDLAAQITAPTLQLLTEDATRLGLALDVALEVGVLGGTSAAGWRRYDVRRVSPIGDGLEVLVTLIPRT